MTGRVLRHLPDRQRRVQGHQLPAGSVEQMAGPSVPDGL